MWAIKTNCVVLIKSTPAHLDFQVGRLVLDIKSNSDPGDA